MHRLGVYGALGRSFKTTNCLESVNALVEERCAKVDHWKNSSQRQRWLATALVDIEPRLRRVIGYRHLPKLREALKRELKIETKTSNGVEEKGRLIYEPWRVSTKNGLDSVGRRLGIPWLSEFWHRTGSVHFSMALYEPSYDLYTPWRYLSLP